MPNKQLSMGILLGKIVVETPQHQVLAAADGYEIRKYPPTVVAEVTYHPSDVGGKRDGGFGILANYIGAFSKPQNTKPEKIAMTLPVITKSPEKIAMTLPVITSTTDTDAADGRVTMQFVLPAKYASAAEAPAPLDERVAVRDVGEKKYGVVKFSGVARDEVVRKKVVELKESLERDGYKIIGEFVLARYNPPWIPLPPLRTNEVMLPVE